TDMAISRDSATGLPGHTYAAQQTYSAQGPFTTAFNPGSSRAQYTRQSAPPPLLETMEPAEDNSDAPLGELESRYEWIVGLMSSFTDERVVRIIVAFFTASMGVCATLEILFGFRATSPLAFGFQIGTAVFAYAAALWWLVITWPKLRTAFAFIIIADIMIATANISANIPPEYAVGKTAFLVVLGLLAGVFLDRWMLATHILLVAGLITGIIAYNMIFEGVPPLGALVVGAPVISLAFAIPIMLYTFVRAIRLDQS
ncbi:MAG: hypothetical protein WBF79_08305, partial [Rhodococcus sp. (in: high G+C Gram-positive bacteria)]